MKAAVSDIRRLGGALFVESGASDADADTVVEHLLDADAMGLRSHGVMRIPQYLAEIVAGELDPHASPEIVLGKPGRAAVDGGGTFGQVVAMRMATLAVELAQSTGIGLVTGRRMGHTGRIGAYPEVVAESGLLGIAVCSGAPSGHWVAPFGGRHGRLPTNPISFAYPVEAAGPVVADFSTATAPEGVIRNLRSRGLQAPPGWIRKADGTPTTDPLAIYASPRGAIQPLGGDLGYRGTALAVLVEVLSTLLSGDAVDDGDRKGSTFTIIAIELDAGFDHLADGLSRHIRSSGSIDPSRPVLMPGDRERAARQGAGPTIEIDAPTWSALEHAAALARIQVLTEVE